jgi:ribosomal protein S18 acetylase RimI-like enzyme
MSELATLGLARPSDAREIAEMSRDFIEHGLSWSWTPARVQHFITGADSSVVVARRDRSAGYLRGWGTQGDPRHAGGRLGDGDRGGRRGIDAFAIMHFDDEVAHLNLLAVAPEHRRQGLGRQLMDWLTATAIEAGVFRINLEVRTQNDQARVFYERLGFDPVGVVPGYYQGREAALRMSRRLAKNQC